MIHSEYEANVTLLDKRLTAQTSLKVSFEHVLINPNSFMGTQHSVRPLHKTFLLNKPQAFLKFISGYILPQSILILFYVSAKCRISNPQLTDSVKHSDDLQ